MQSRITVPLMPEHASDSPSERGESLKYFALVYSSITKHREPAPSCGPSVPLEV